MSEWSGSLLSVEFFFSKVEYNLSVQSRDYNNLTFFSQFILIVGFFFETKNAQDINVLIHQPIRIATIKMKCKIVCLNALYA